MSSSNRFDREGTDPSVYDEHHKRYEKDGLPQSTTAWISRAHEVSRILEQDAAKRDRENKCPRAEVALLKSSGLTKLLGPKEYGGGGEPWSTAYKVIREVCKGDGSIGMLLGYHLNWSSTASIEGTDVQKENMQKLIIENNYMVSGAVNPRNDDLTITDDGDHLIFNGKKMFTTAGVVSELTVLEGVLKEGDKHIFTIVKTDQPGVIFGHDWDAIGMRLSESGSITFKDIRVPWTDALGYDAKTKEAIPEVTGCAYATFLLPIFQLIFSNMYLGIALGALHAGSNYTRTKTRAWPYAGGDEKSSPLDEFYILERYGRFRSHLASAEALCDYCGQEVDRVMADAKASTKSPLLGNGYESNDLARSGPTVEGRAAISARRRGEVAALVSHAKVCCVDFGLEVSSGILEVMGASSAVTKYGHDKYWRDIRIHSLHDPVAYKCREVGRLQLCDEIPVPSWYN